MQLCSNPKYWCFLFYFVTKWLVRVGTETVLDLYTLMKIRPQSNHHYVVWVGSHSIYTLRKFCNAMLPTQSWSKIIIQFEKWYSRFNFDEMSLHTNEFCDTFWCNWLSKSYIFDHFQGQPNVMNLIEICLTKVLLILPPRKTLLQL